MQHVSLFSHSRSLGACVPHLCPFWISERTFKGISWTFPMKPRSYGRSSQKKGEGREEGKGRLRAPLSSTYESFIVALDNRDYFISGAMRALHASKRTYMYIYTPRLALHSTFSTGSPCTYQVYASTNRNLFPVAVA